MDIKDLVNPEVLTQPVYQPGRPIEEVAEEQGLDPDQILKLASNENAWGASPKALAAAAEALQSAHIYPDGGSTFLRRKLAAQLQLQPEQIAVGQGSNEILELLGMVFLRPGVEAVMGEKAFIVYKLVTLLRGAKVVEVPLRNFTHDLQAMREAVTDKTRLVFLPSPNNPTGTINSNEEVIEFARSLPEHVVFVSDEAYAEYQEQPLDLLPLIREGRKVVVTRSFSKIYGLAALRVGYAYGPESIIRLLHQVRKPFNVDAVGQAAALAALDDQVFVQQVRRDTIAERDRLEAWFVQKGYEIIPSKGNFILVRFADAAAVNNALLKQGIIVRPLGPYGMPHHLRITVGKREENDRLCQAVEQLR
jgi:histidinol-phosphate aminotransferase